MIYFNDEKTLTKITGLNNSELWKAGINLDDWDYGFIMKGRLKNVVQTDWDIQKILQGPCNNEWYHVKSKNREWYTVGIAYHS